MIASAAANRRGLSQSAIVWSAGSSNMAGTIIAVKTANGTNPKALTSHGGGRLLMPLLRMIKRVEKKKLLGIDGKIYKNLNYLRKLRNKVHIHGVESRFDTDWNAFGDNEFQQSKNVLLAVLTSAQFKASNNGLLSFLEQLHPFKSQS